MPNGLLRAFHCRVAGTSLAVAAVIVLTGCGDGVSTGSTPVAAGSGAATSSTSTTISPSTGNTTTDVVAAGTSITAGGSDTATVDSDGTATITTSETSPLSSTTTVGAQDALLYWNPPMENTDGSQLADLEGYRVYAGKDPEHLDDVANLVWSGYLWVKFTDLAPGTWFFSIRSYNSDGIESDFAPMVSKEIV